ncbi:DUF1853 family protein [Rhodopirellula sp. JC740]|uniref:DUF1853 family protein n=1 Tax=Rhodopirellula halodulae TaxID=2894198 RepID=A0ABS8NNI3_9BACT|nr:DUF1853 family protein [Rhodopirellula sp. JC740]MCC9645154.1 DUF1853 family protein [Rhodopirellula sp. JC740]
MKRIPSPCFPSGQLLADLEWAINSPSLLGQPPAGCRSEIIEVVPANNVDPSKVDAVHLQRWFEEQDRQRPLGRRVGRYFERLVHYWLKHLRRVEMIAHGKPIVEAGRTIGEIDFLYLDEHGKLTHLEVAVKFYLGVISTQRSGLHFVGPNLKDTYDRKVDRMFQHQLQLESEIFPSQPRRTALVKGTLFYPEGSGQPQDTASPPTASQTHLRGEWVRASALRRWCDRNLVSDDRFSLPDKPFWLSAFNGGERDPQTKKGAMVAACLQSIKTQRRPVMATVTSAAAMNPSGNTEFKRLFVAPDIWPDS